MHQEEKMNLWKTLIEIIKNPLILAVVISFPFSYFQIAIHQIILNTGNYLASLALPLALLGIGGSLNLAAIKKASGNCPTQDQTHARLESTCGQIHRQGTGALKL